MTLVAPQFRTRGVPLNPLPRLPRPRSAASALSRRRSPRVPRPATVLTTAGIVLVPWIAVLARTLPHTVEVSHWSTAWIGLDVILAAGLAGTGLLLGRGDPRAGAAAAATAAVLVLDAWFDVTTSAAGGARMTAVALAVCAELPLAALCARAAVRSPEPEAAPATV
ncbi:hypothetical protein ABZY31_25150 [Streptomyces sp. NPDC006529]|uniref:hypothetical protein n=1 Tax=Streptomyces sp. NPDC006529 TaxID=3157177 RepID=UPI0033AF29C3